MNKNLLNMGEEKGMECDGSWVRIAFNEILGSIYHSEVKEAELDKLIEKMASILFEKLGIKEKNLDWQKVEEWQHKETYNLVSYDYYFNFDEATKIICKSKVSKDYDWEDISSGAMDIENIHEKMIGSFNETIKEYNSMKKEILEEFYEKGIYVDFRQGTC